VERRSDSATPNRKSPLVGDHDLTVEWLFIVFGDLSCSRNWRRCTCSLLIVSSVRRLQPVRREGVGHRQEFETFVPARNAFVVFVVFVPTGVATWPDVAHRSLLPRG
jgi:hypothetical protein